MRGRPARHQVIESWQLNLVQNWFEDVKARVPK